MRSPRRRRRQPAWRRGSVRIYRALLWLYPPSLRQSHGEEMLQLFGDNLRDEIARSGPPGAVRAWATTLADLAVSLPREWPHELRSRRFRLRRSVAGYHVHRRPRGRSVVGRRGASGGMQYDMFQRFTERARKVMSLAQEEAQRFNHNYIGTEHLLLGLVAEGNGVAAKVLANLGVELEQVRNAVEFIIGRGDRIVLGEIGLTPRSKRVIELAVDEARRLNHHYVGTEHLLLGLVREGDGIAAGVLASLGINLEKVRSATLDVLNQGAAPPSTAALTRPRPGADLGRFSERARRVIADAITEARERDQREVGTGHALVALLQGKDGIVSEALWRAGFDLDATRARVEQSIGPRTQSGDPPAHGPVDLDIHTLRMIALAAEEAQQMEDRYVGPEHLLLGLLHEGDGLGAQVLLAQGASLNHLRSLCMQIRAQATSSRDKRPTFGRITLICGDVAVTSGFYTRNFAATRDAVPSEPLQLRMPGGGPLLVLRASTEDATPSSAASIELEIWVSDVALMWRNLKDSDTQGLSEISDSPRGHYFTVPDPDGRLLRIYAHPA